MEKRLIIHVGGHKTGSTYIQRCCFAHRQRLEELGFSYPNLDDSFAHHGLGHELASILEGEKPRLWELLRQHIRSTNFSTYLISSESMDRISEVEIKLLSELVSETGVDVEIVFLIRNQIDCIESGALGSRRPKTFRLANDKRLELATQKLRHKFVGFYNVWANSFGRNNLRWQVYELAKPLLSSFFELIEFDPGKSLAEQNGKINSRKDARLVFILREFAKSLEATPTDVEFRIFLNQLYKIVDAKLEMKPFNGSIFDNAFRQKVCSYFLPFNVEAHEELARLTEHYFSPQRDLVQVTSFDTELTTNLTETLNDSSPDSKLFKQFKSFLCSASIPT